MIKTMQDLEDFLRRWGRVYGQRPPTEWDLPTSLTPSPSAAAMNRAPASEMGRARRLGLLDHVNTGEKSPAPNWHQYAVTCSETRTPRGEPVHDEFADRIEREAIRLYRFSALLGVVLRVNYCMRGTHAEKAEWAGTILGTGLTRNRYRDELDKARAWMSGALCHP